MYNNLFQRENHTRTIISPTIPCAKSPSRSPTLISIFVPAKRAFHAEADRRTTRGKGEEEEALGRETSHGKSLPCDHYVHAREYLTRGRARSRCVSACASTDRAVTRDRTASRREKDVFPQRGGKFRKKRSRSGNKADEGDEGRVLIRVNEFVDQRR